MMMCGNPLDYAQLVPLHDAGCSPAHEGVDAASANPTVTVYG